MQKRTTSSKNSQNFRILLIIALALIVAGSAAVICGFQQHTFLLLQRQDEQLYQMVEARDRSLHSKFCTLHKQMAYLVQRQGFLRAEDQWEETGDPEKLLSLMQDNPAAHDDNICAMIVIQDGRSVLSTAGRMDCRFPYGTHDEIFLCKDSAGKHYLAFAQTTSMATYAALMDLEHYLECMTDIVGDSEFQLMLMDASRQLLMHQWTGENRVEHSAELTAQTCDMQAFERLEKSILSNERETGFYTVTNPDTGTRHRMRLSTLPVSRSKNGFFSIALIACFDEFVKPIHLVSICLLISGIVIAAGVLILSVLMICLVKYNRQSDEKADQLEEQNQEISILLEKTQQLAHHQRLETIGTLASGIAHEFNNLLTPIMSCSLMTLEKLPEEMEEIGENMVQIYEASSKAKVIIARLSELSRKNTAMSVAFLGMDETIRKALEVAGTACPVNVKIQSDLRCGTEGLMGNNTQMSQLFLNLFINAFQAMHANGGELRVSSRVQGDELMVEVADSGCGIAPEILPRIFEPFFTTRAYENGTGLGLAIVQQLVESHQGNISVKSSEGEGAVFTLRFLRAQDAPSDEEETHQP